MASDLLGMLFHEPSPEEKEAQRIAAQQQAAARMAAQQAEIDQAKQRSDERARRWAAENRPGTGAGQSGTSASGGDARLQLWKSQNAKTEDQGESDRLERIVQDIYDRSLEEAEKEAGLDRTSSIKSALDATLDDVGESLPPVSRFLMQQAVDKAKERIINQLRVKFGDAACAETGFATGSEHADATYRAMMQGVCGGWIGRPLSATGVYGYLSDEIVEKFSTFFGAALGSAGLMPPERPSTKAAR